ncbi:ribulokinase [Rugosimonospora acidiphila]|uniref:Ribulokinase n=1 Tax=Rugosimonospora acidiphila TaxID=556531 RepID=A0ABP9SSB4_9ACTN
MASYVVGIDFGTLSGRALVVRVEDGAELASAVHPFAHGVIDRTLGGEELPQGWALQDPEDYRDVLREAVPEAVRAAGVEPREVIGIGIDFTACTALPVLRDGTPLSQLPEFADRPHAYAKLWKHHAAQPYADQINELAVRRGEGWLGRYGGRISAEWQFAKGLQLLAEDPEIYARTDRWIEAADWITWQLAGVETRNVCTAGYKGILQDGRYPSSAYLSALDPDFAGFVTDKLAHPLSELGARAGGLTATAAAWTGLPEGIAVAVGNVDAHVTAPAVGALRPGQMLAVMGTSICHVMNGERLAELPGMCGVVQGGISPGLWGYEAGQSGVGDIFAWYVENCVPPSYHARARREGVDLHTLLSGLGAAQPVGAHGLVALDWHSGNRSVLADHDLTGVIVGQSLATRPEDTYWALMEATAFGTRTIIEAFESAGLPVTELVAAGGLIRNPYLMQLYSDVTRRPVATTAAEQGPALGAAIHAAVAAGAYPDIYRASEEMSAPRAAVYQPDTARADGYDALYGEYRRLHDYFGRGGNDVLHRLRARARRQAVIA